MNVTRHWRRRPSDEATARRRLVEHLRRADISDERVIEAIGNVPRERFVSAAQMKLAYSDRALPIGHGQTISQPLMVATLVSALEIEQGDSVLDVGTGSGYQAAVIAACGARVVSVERVPALADSARQRLSDLGLPISVHVADGSLGWTGGAPYDAIAVAAAAPAVPQPLVAQLADGGRLVVPVAAGADRETLVRVRRRGSAIDVEDLGPCRFVPLIGEAGYARPGEEMGSPDGN